VLSMGGSIKMEFGGDTLEFLDVFYATPGATAVYGYIEVSV